MDIRLIEQGEYIRELQQTNDYLVILAAVLALIISYMLIRRR